MGYPASLIHRLNRRDTKLVPNIPFFFKAVLVITLILGLHFVPKIIHSQEIDPASDPNTYYSTAQQQRGNQEFWVANGSGSIIKYFL